MVVNALSDAGSVAAERGEGYISETHLLLALALDESTFFSQMLPGLGIDREAMIERLRTMLDGAAEWDAQVRAQQSEQDT